MAEKTFTARQIAERYEVAGSTVRGWLLRRLLPGAYLQKTELGDSYWLVPESALKDFVPPKPGPVPKQPASAEKAATGRASANGGQPARATKQGNKKKGKR